MNLYQSNDNYLCHIYGSMEEWKNNRNDGIGGSDVSSFIGQNKYRSNVQLWKDKHNKVHKDKTNPAMEYGNEAEAPLRKLFALKHPEYDVQYVSFCKLQSTSKSYRIYSPDGLIYEKETGRKGIYEGKTSLIQNTSTYRHEWIDCIPQNYFIQTLHGLLVTDFDFVVLNAELRFAWKRNTEIVEYYFTKEEVLDSLAELDKQEDEQWQYYEKGIKPPYISNL